MKRKLIEFNVFERLEKDSLSSAQYELQQAGPILAKSLGLSEVSLHCFSPETVIYETHNGEFVHASFSVDDNHITYDNIEQLVIDQKGETKRAKEKLSEMVDALLGGEDKKAEMLFEGYLNLPSKRIFSESKKRRKIPKYDKSGKIVGYRIGRWETHAKHPERSSDTRKRVIGKHKRDIKTSTSQKALNKSRRDAKHVMANEWTNLCENVFDYVEFQELGPAVRQTQVQHDDKGNVVSLRIPTSNARNEAKILSFNWKTLNTDVVVKRSAAQTISENVNFCKAVAELKRHNALSDNVALEEVLEAIVSKWPEVLYLTQSELAGKIGVALETVNATNYDDQTCEFMAEGILRKAHSSYVDRVGKILRLAGFDSSKVEESENYDAYATFQSVVSKFYAGLDETTQLEMQVFVDLYEALRGVREIAVEDENHILRAEAEGHLNHLVPILQQEIEPTLDVAQSAASWLHQFIETNLETAEWNPSNSVHITVSGDHPLMKDKARHKYAPYTDFSGDWGDSAPVSDGKNYKGGLADEMRNRSWGNSGGPDTFPSLNNPYVPGATNNWTISGEKTIDGDSNQLAHSGGNDTWPSLQNPYVPAALGPMQDKMNQGKEPDLVVDQ